MTSVRIEPPPCSPLDFSSTRWPRLVLLVDLHAGGLRLDVLRGDKCRHLGLPHRRRPARHAACCRRRRRRDAGDRLNRVRNDTVSHLACCQCGPVRLPATSAGYHVVLAMAQIGVPSLAWREVFACLGAVFIDGTAWTRLTVFTEPLPVEQGNRSATVLSQFSRRQRARDDLLTLVVEQVRVDQRAGVFAA